MIININDIAEVKLTSYGLNIINYHYIDVDVKPAGLNENVLEAPLWDIMAIFGKYLFMGDTNMVFENNEIKIIRTVK